MKRAFVAGNHKCWFSNKYPNKLAIEVAEIDPKYMQWCIANLKHLNFADRIKEKVKKHLSITNKMS